MKTTKTKSTVWRDIESFFVDVFPIADFQSPELSFDDPNHEPPEIITIQEAKETYSLLVYGAVYVPGAGRWQAIFDMEIDGVEYTRLLATIFVDTEGRPVINIPLEPARERSKCESVFIFPTDICLVSRDQVSRDQSSDS